VISFSWKSAELGYPNVFGMQRSLKLNYPS